MTAQDYISRFNRFNGNPLKVSTLKAYAADVQKYIDRVGTGYGITELKQIVARCNFVSKGQPADGVFESVVVDPIVLKPIEKKKKVEAKLGTIKKTKPEPKRIIEFLDGYLILEDERDNIIAKLEDLRDLFPRVITEKEFQKQSRLFERKIKSIDSALDIQAEQGAKYMNDKPRDFMDLLSIYVENKGEFKKKLYNSGLDSFRIRLNGLRNKKQPIKKHLLKAKPVKKKVKASNKPKPAEVVEKLSQKVKEQPHTVKLKGLGIITADQAPEKAANTFVLPGVIGSLLGTLQRFKLQIMIAGETHSAKSQLGMQIANAFAERGDDVLWLDWEQGGLQSVDTQNSIKRNVAPANKKRIHVTGEVPRTLEAVKELTKHYKVIAMDSGTKLKQMTNAWIDELREEYPDVVWIIMMQQNEKGGTRGGSSAEFDAPVVLKTYRPDESDFMKNYAVVFKNRGNKTGLKYSMPYKAIIPKQNIQQQPIAA